jgi:hypothetical protein
MMRLRLFGVVCVGLVFCGACNQAAPSGRSYTLLRQDSVTMAAAFDAAERAVKERFRVAERDPAAGLLRTAPVLRSAPAEGTRLGDTLRTPRRMRTTVEVRVNREGDGVAIGCKALIEENQAGAHSLFVREHAISDVPSDTPAERGAAATNEQNAAWKPAGRDRALEREIVRAIGELLGQPPGSAETG